MGLPLRFDVCTRLRDDSFILSLSLSYSLEEGGEKPDLCLPQAYERRNALADNRYYARGCWPIRSFNLLFFSFGLFASLLSLFLYIYFSPPFGSRENVCCCPLSSSVRSIEPAKLLTAPEGSTEGNRCFCIYEIER